MIIEIDLPYGWAVLERWPNHVNKRVVADIDLTLTVSWTLTWEMIRIRNFYCFVYRQHIWLRKWEVIVGDMIDHVGIYGARVAEGLSASNVGLVTSYRSYLGRETVSSSDVWGLSNWVFLVVIASRVISDFWCVYFPPRIARFGLRKDFVKLKPELFSGLVEFHQNQYKWVPLLWWVLMKWSNFVHCSHFPMSTDVLNPMKSMYYRPATARVSCKFL